MKLRHFLLLSSLLVPLLAYSQDTATLSGTLTDPSGAAIAGAQITAEAVASRSNAARATSDAEGRFSLTLAPGRYRVRVAHASFRSEERRVGKECRL